VRTFSLKKASIPKVAVLATGLVGVVMVASIGPLAAQAVPSRARDCAECHAAGGSTTATPSTLTPAGGATYSVAITLAVNPSGGNSGYAIVPVTTGTGTANGGNSSSALSYSATMTAPVAAGTYSYHVYTNQGSTDPDGQASSASYSITVPAAPTTVPPTTVPPTTVPPDHVAPTISMTAPASPYSLTTSMVPAWTARDTGGAIANVDVRWQRAAFSGGFAAAVYPSAWQRTRAVRATLAGVAPGYTYCFSARARDTAGNLSPWSAARCSAVALDDRSLAATAGWARAKSSLFYRGTATTTTRSAVTLTRTGVQAKRIYLVATRGPKNGTVGVYWNGVLLKKVSLAATKTTRRNVIGVAAFTSIRTGKLTIRTLVNKKSVQIDGVSLVRG
jgi:hypothetical protein